MAHGYSFQSAVLVLFACHLVLPASWPPSFLTLRTLSVRPLGTGTSGAPSLNEPIYIFKISHVHIYIYAYTYMNTYVHICKYMHTH